MNSDKIFQLVEYFKYQNQLKTVLRNNQTTEGRKESSSEHSWSVAMMVWLLTPEIEAEFGLKLDQLKSIKMALIHDIVEIDAGDVAAWDDSGRVNIKNSEQTAILGIDQKYFKGEQSEIFSLWNEHDKLETLESKLVKACDQLCPLVYRIVFLSSYKDTGVDRAKLDQIFDPIVAFSTTTQFLYNHLANLIEEKKLFDSH